MICIYHNKDLDGFCSGAIVKKKYPDAIMIGYDYGQELLWEEEYLNHDVIMIDVSLPMERMESLANASKSLTWIDHHVSAINDYNAYMQKSEPFLIPVLEVGIAACEIAWIYLFPKQLIPSAVELLGEYDTWRNGDKYQWDNYIMPFQWGMRIDCQSPETFPNHLLSDDNHDNDIDDIISRGKLILNYQKTQNERACKSSFEIEFEGLRAIVLNNGGANSSVFDSVYDPEKHDIMMPFVITGNHCTFSIYTTHDALDCSVLAKKYGGGGHKKAAGFKVDFNQLKDILKK